MFKVDIKSLSNNFKKIRTFELKWIGKESGCANYDLSIFGAMTNAKELSLTNLPKSVLFKMKLDDPSKVFDVINISFSSFTRLDIQHDWNFLKRFKVVRLKNFFIPFRIEHGWNIEELVLDDCVKYGGFFEVPSSLKKIKLYCSEDKKTIRNCLDNCQMIFLSNKKLEVELNGKKIDRVIFYNNFQNFFLSRTITDDNIIHWKKFFQL
jgi:hypothetical protein